MEPRQPLDSKEKLYLEINEANVGTFHFHGLRSSYPVTACVVLPKDTRAETLLLGQYASTSESLVMLVQPLGVIQGVLDSVLRVRNLVLAGLLLVTACLLLVILFSASPFDYVTVNSILSPRLELQEVWFWNLRL